MRGITITYKYSGDEAVWQTAISEFINSINDDPDVSGKFVYRVSIADDGETRIHWGRWDSQETLQTMQSRDYFKTFAGHVKAFSGGDLTNIATNNYLQTDGW